MIELKKLTDIKDLTAAFEITDKDGTVWMTEQMNLSEIIAELH